MGPHFIMPHWQWWGGSGVMPVCCPVHTHVNGNEWLSDDHILTQKHDSRDSGSLCMGSFSSSWWCPLCRIVYLGRKERANENSTGILQRHLRKNSISLNVWCDTGDRVVYKKWRPKNCIQVVLAKGEETSLEGNSKPGGTHSEWKRWDQISFFPRNPGTLVLLITMSPAYHLMLHLNIYAKPPWLGTILNLVIPKYWLKCIYHSGPEKAIAFCYCDSFVCHLEQ